MARIKLQKTAAVALGVSARTLQTWAAEAWFPAGGLTDDGYDVELIKSARDEIGKKGSEEADQSRQLTIAKQEIDVQRKRVELEDLQLALEAKRGKVVSRAAVVEYQRQVVAVVRDRLLGIPEEMARLVPRDLKTKVRVAAEQRLREILGWMARESEVVDNEKKHREWKRWRVQTRRELRELK